MYRLTLAVLAFAVMTASAFAQGHRPPSAPRQLTPEEMQKKREAADIERRYNAAIKATPAPSTGPKDPWAIVRGTSDGKSGQQ